MATLACVTCAAHAHADSVTLEALPSRFLPSTPFDILVSLENSSTRQGLQIDIGIDPTKARPISARLLGRLRSAGVQLYYSESPPGLFHILIYDPSAIRASIPAGADTVVAVTFDVAPSVGAADTLLIQTTDGLAAAEDLAPVAIGPALIKISHDIPTATFVQAFRARLLDDASVQIEWELSTDASQVATNVYRQLEGVPERTRVNNDPVVGAGPNFLQDRPPENSGLVTYYLMLVSNQGEIEVDHVDLQVGQSLPTRFALYQNSPNPFSSLTGVRFDLPRASRVRIAVYDVAGRRVRVLQDAVLPPGRYSRTWDGQVRSGETAAGGVYFLVAESGGKRLVRKIVRLK